MVSLASSAFRKVVLGGHYVCFLDRIVSLDYVDSLSHGEVQQVSKKESKPWQRKQWSMAPKNHAEFVCIMEDILSVYLQYFSAQFPLVCTNESS